MSSKNLLLVFLLGSICYLFVAFEGVNSAIYSFLILVNSWIAIYNMLNNSRYPYSIGKMVNFFMLVFFILANAMQYGHNSTVVTFNVSFTDAEYIWFQVLVSFILISFNGIYSYIINRIPSTIESDAKYITYSKTLIAISSFCLIFILAYYRFNLITLFFRGLTEDMLQQYGVVQQESMSTATSLIIDKVVRPIPWCAFLISLYCRCHRSVKVVLFIMAFIVVCPTGISRNAAAIYWLPVVVVLLSKYIVGNRFIYLMLFGILVIFPFMDNFRRFTGDIEFKFSMDYLDSLNMDASQMLMATIKYDVITYGNQLLGVLFFWMPRSIWLTKPIGSGAFLAEKCNASWTNVSMPFWGEGYINFGIVGIIIFIIFGAIMAAKLDANFWSAKNRLRNPQTGYYLILVGAIVFIMRGDLLSSFAYTVGTLLSYLITIKICVRQTNQCIVNGEKIITA